ncbi:MAG: hypothetical protein IT579_25185 [Verrucomicrobia subdivision 3 bacterium]|nr:hypothetical protein [Limisphaerales bacterium]
MSQAKVQAGGYHRESLDNTWRTPENILERVFYFGGPIPFDPATGPENPTRALRYCTGDLPAPPVAPSLFPAPVEQLDAERLALARADGLATPWDWPTWCNPPYGGEIKAWLAKFVRESGRGTEIVALLPCSRWETSYLQEALVRAVALCLIRKRVAFVSSQDGAQVGGNTTGSMLVGWNVRSVSTFFAAFRPLGACFELGQAATQERAERDMESA